MQVDLMCAFTSAITPSAVGGSPAAIFYLNREGISVGRAATLTLTTLMLDEFFFVLFCPIIVLTIPFDSLFGEGGLVLGSVRIIFWTVYSVIVVYTFVLYAGILWRPQAVARVFHKIFSLRWIRRWQPAVDRMTGNMVVGRQFVVWVVLMVSPTPGGSGVSEWLFSNYYGDLIGNTSLALLLAIVWRLFSYYVYLIAGAFLVPRYFKKRS